MKRAIISWDINIEDEVQFFPPLGKHITKFEKVFYWVFRITKLTFLLEHIPLLKSFSHLWIKILLFSFLYILVLISLSDMICKYFSQSVLSHYLIIYIYIYISSPVFFPGESHGQEPGELLVHRVKESRTQLKRLSIYVTNTCSFCLFTIDCTQILNFHSQICSFFSFACTFGVISKKLLPNPMLWSICPIFFSFLMFFCL